MAANLEWLAEAVHPGRKLIIWAHNGHIMNAYYSPGWSYLSHEPLEGGMKPMGVSVVERFGRDVYTLAFTAYSGECAPFTGDEAQPVGQMRPGWWTASSSSTA